MKLYNHILIEASANKVWEVLARDFDKADLWMASVPKSYEKVEGTKADGAQMVGRICHLSNDDNGAFADETITGIDDENMVLKINVVPKNGKIPVEQANNYVKVEAVSENKTKVTWNTDVDLKTPGKILYPVVRAALNKSFKDILGELKHWVETGKPHPRKQKRLAKAAA